MGLDGWDKIGSEMTFVELGDRIWELITFSLLSLLFENVQKFKFFFFKTAQFKNL